MTTTRTPNGRNEDMDECPSCRDFGKEEFHADHWPTRKTSAHCSRPGCRRAALTPGAACDDHESARPA